MRLSSAAAIFLAVAGFGSSSQWKAPATPRDIKSGWVLTWHDEFNGPTGSAPDPTKWVAENGGGGWGNSELECYTPRQENVRQEGGKLVIEAIKEKFTGPDGVERNYTSARIKTQGHFAQKYGRFESRIKVPYTQGLWPAFWLLGDDFSTVGWPASGEIDIMEIVGFKPFRIYSTLHGPGYSGSHGLASIFAFDTESTSHDYHVFAAEWEPQAVRFCVDGVAYATKTPADLPPGARWVFDHPFFIVLNMAVGGNLPGSPDESTVLPQRMLVDYVRVYARQ